MLSVLKVLRILRVLRPLRAINRAKGLKVCLILPKNLFVLLYMLFVIEFQARRKLSRSCAKDHPKHRVGHSTLEVHVLMYRCATLQGILLLLQRFRKANRSRMPVIVYYQYTQISNSFLTFYSSKVARSTNTKGAN